MILLQQGGPLSGLLGATNITVAGLLIIAVIALYLGLVTPKHTVEEMRLRLKEREEENDTLHRELMRAAEEKAELRGEMTAIRRELEQHRREIEALREEIHVLRLSGRRENS
ncbi:MAG: hypothetical protein M3R38_05985 [Actinomycetota bacterium]|nr:hypothetical protein [Actinomycetota bacterium]